MDRLDELYQRKLVSTETRGKTFPLEKALERPIQVWPECADISSAEILEIGPGTGDFLFHLAEQHKDKTVMAIELGKKRFEKIKERITKKNLQNIILIGGDARVLVYKHVKEAQLKEIYVLFPDPWPKTKHAHMRLLQKDFVIKLAEALSKNGTLTLATDVKDYATWSVTNFRESKLLVSDLEAEIVRDLPEIIPTFFKKKWIERGREFFYSRFKKQF